MVQLGEKTKVVVEWAVQPVNYSREKADSLAHKMAKKYGVPKDNIVIEPKFVTKRADGQEVPLTNELITNIQDPKFQQMMFVQYAEDNDIEDFDAEAINEIDDQLNTQIDYEVYDKFKKYEVKWIRWSNFLSYGAENYLDFTKLHGLVHLKGEPANESGKSTLAYDLLHFLLFGKASSEKADVLAKLFNRHIPEATECVVEGCLCIEGQDYVIKRTVSRPKLDKRTDKSKVTQKINYYKVTNGVETELDDVDNMEGQTGTETNKVIKEAIGNEKDFDMVISANADNLKSLISLKDTERGRLLARWIGLLPLEEKDAKAREMWNHEILPNLISTKYNREELKSEIEDWEWRKGVAEGEVTKAEKQLTDIKHEIEILTLKKENLIASKQPVDQELLKVDVATVEASMERIKGEGIEKNKELEQKKARLEEIGDVDFSEDAYKAKSKEKSDLEIKQAERRTEITGLKTLNQELEKGEYCPVCKRKFDDIDNTDKIEDNKKKIEELTNIGVADAKKVKEMEDELSAMETNRSLFNEKNRIEIQIEAIDTNIKNLRLEFKNKRDLKKRFEDNWNLISKNNEIDLEIKNTNITIEAKEGVKSTLIRNIEQYKRDIQDYEKKIENNNDLIERIIKEEKKVRDWKIYLRMVGKDGIGKMVLRQALPLINSELARLLEDVCDFDVEVTIDDYNDVAFNIVRDGVVGNLNSGSGYEKTAASIALRAVLGKISTMPKPSFIVLDEVLGGVAEENYDNIKKLYDRILPDYSHVFHITHLQQLEDWAQQTITVKKENNISRVLENA